MRVCGNSCATMMDTGALSVNEVAALEVLYLQLLEGGERAYPWLIQIFATLKARRRDKLNAVQALWPLGLLERYEQLVANRAAVDLRVVLQQHSANKVADAFDRYYAQVPEEQHAFNVNMARELREVALQGSDAVVVWVLGHAVRRAHMAVFVSQFDWYTH